MRRADFIAGVILCVFGLGMLLFGIPTQIDEAPRGFVSPRLVPNLTMMAIVGLSILLMFKAWRGVAYDKAQEPVFSAHELRMALQIAGVLAAAIVAFVTIGPLAGGIALIVGALLALGERRPWILIIFPAVLLTGVWALFYKVLGTAIV